MRHGRSAARGPALGALLVLSAASPARPQAPPEYRVGSGDVLALEVVGHPELSALAPVRPDGRIRVHGGQSIGVAELSPREIAGLVSAALRRSTGVDHEVGVSVHEYRSRFVSVEGAVAQPGRVPLRGGTRLVDVLVEAGGFAPGASGEVVILRRTDPGDAPLRRLRVQVPADLDGRGLVNLEQPLEHGDRVAALLVEHVAVGGAVRRPGLYRVRDAPTLLAALALAGGTGRSARFAALERRSGERLEVDLEAARRGEGPDPALAPSDLISVR